MNESLVIADYQTLMLIHELADRFNLSEKEKNKELPSGNGRTFLYDRIHWAVKYLKHAGLLERTKRGHYKITRKGTVVLNTHPEKIDKKYLKQFPEFVQYIKN